jgi:hypothetical protein
MRNSKDSAPICHDGSVWQIKDWLKKHAYDHSTLRVPYWGKVTDAKDDFTVCMTFKASIISPPFSHHPFHSLFISEC